MRAGIRKHFNEVLSHLYINPLERCNLCCKICYTKKTDPILMEEEILEFITRYEKVKKLKTITFCGGEVFALPYFPKLVNTLIRGVRFSDSAACARRDPLSSVHVTHYSRAQLQRSSKRTISSSLLIQIITNGTIDRLSEFENPNMVNLIVSLDGLKKYHDANRGRGNFDKSIGFIKKAKSLGFHLAIFSIVTRQNIGQIDEFEQYIYSNVIPSKTRNLSTHLREARMCERSFDSLRSLRMTENKISVTYHPRKPPAYLTHHPQSNVFGKVAGFDFLTDSEMRKIMQKRRTFPPKNLGCFQIALASSGAVYGCCEGTAPIGKMNDEIKLLIGNLGKRLEIWEKDNKIRNCLGCSQPDFVCGMKKYLCQKE